MTTRHTRAMAALARGGFIPAVPLAVDDERRFDEGRQRRLIRHYLDCGADGVAAAVHTTQFEIRHPAYNLLLPVLRAVREETDAYEAHTGRVIIRIAGACGPTEQAVSEARLAATEGYDAVLLSPGGLGGMTQDAMIERTEAVAAVLPVVGFYLQHKVGGIRLGYDYWRRLCAIDNVAAVKCAAFDRYATVDVARAAAPRGVALYTGNDDNIIADLLTPYRFGDFETRFVGGLLGHWAVWTKRAVELFREAKNAKPTSALLALGAQVTDMNAAVFDAANDFAGCIAGVQEVLRREGLLANNLCLDPAVTLSPGQTGELDRVYKMYPHLI